MFTSTKGSAKAWNRPLTGSASWNRPQAFTSGWNRPQASNTWTRPTA